MLLWKEEEHCCKYSTVHSLLGESGLVPPGRLLEVLGKCSVRKKRLGNDRGEVDSSLIMDTALCPNNDETTFITVIRLYNSLNRGHTLNSGQRLWNQSVL